MVVMNSTTFEHAKSLLGENNKNKIANNTFAILQYDGSIAIRLYATDILTFYPDGSIAANANGHRTKTTKERINSLLPNNFCKVYAKKFDWLWENGKAFEDGQLVPQK